VEKVDRHRELFSREEARIIASLMEKELTTPNNYPLTLNSLLAACNQKSNRDPVMEMTEGQVGNFVNRMADKGLLFIEYGERAIRISHKARSNFSLDRKQQAILAVLMLRDPQTLNDILTRTTRMVDFSGSDEILRVVEDFIARRPPLAVRFPRGEGRREDRYSHLLCGEPEIPANARPSRGGTRDSSAATEIDRLTALEKRVSELEEKIRILEAQG
jgi:hypothetical protein